MMTDSVLPSAPQTLASKADIVLPLPASGRVRWGRIAFRLLAWLFAGCIAVQVFFAGLAIFAGPSWWSVHTTFVHLIEVLPLLMLIAAVVGRLPARAKWLSIAALLLIGLQFVLVELPIPGVAALHPVNALLIFGLAASLARWSSPRPSRVDHAWS